MLPIPDSVLALLLDALGFLLDVRAPLPGDEALAFLPDRVTELGTQAFTSHGMSCLHENHQSNNTCRQYKLCTGTQGTCPPA